MAKKIIWECDYSGCSAQFDSEKEYIEHLAHCTGATTKKLHTYRFYVNRKYDVEFEHAITMVYCSYGDWFSVDDDSYVISDKALNSLHGSYEFHTFDGSEELQRAVKVQALSQIKFDLQYRVTELTDRLKELTAVTDKMYELTAEDINEVFSPRR